MSSIYIGSPWPGDSVERSFFVTGSATLDTPSGCQILVTVKDTNGTTIAIAALNFDSTAGTLIPWGSLFTVSADFFDCSVTAEMRPTGSNSNDPPFTQGVDGFDIEQDNGGLITILP